ncbi:signal peptidase II [Nocardiopsis gilva YIM 90087]|uniref:Lipoprotein signal peptidase n=1 Tax=Nocardiopsis gilva YIM 90087 TaxID=1235441 RepID=A0A223S5M8_9ACTN|nr:signal peptidase II [Nocardiopsis gilva]ASU83432.1 signal peptidase II [Nocardiopsis gilva YIM 90087]
MNGPAANKPRRFVLLLTLAVVAFVADFASKEIVLAQLLPGETVSVVGELLRLTLVFNSGAAFSIGTGMTWLFTLIASVVAIYIVRVGRNLRSTGWAIALGLILGGATGNLYDRFFRPPGPLYGEVVDWIQLPNWPVFNLADSCIVVGGVLAVVLAFRGINIDGTRESDAEADTGDNGTGEGNGQDESAATPTAPEGPAADETEAADTDASEQHRARDNGADEGDRT